MNRYKRQTDLFNPSEHAATRVTVIGLGNIGSHTTLALARMGLSQFRLIDFDTVEEHNLASQSYTPHDIDTLKTDAIAAQIAAINSAAQVELYPVPFLSTELEYTDSDIVIVAVDSLETRRDIASKLPDNVLVIDGRMGGGQIEAYIMAASDWPDTIPSEADTDACSGRYISYTSYIIAGIIAALVKRHLCGEEHASRVLLSAHTFELLTV